MDPREKLEPDVPPEWREYACPHCGHWELADISKLGQFYRDPSQTAAPVYMRCGNCSKEFDDSTAAGYRCPSGR